MQERENPMETDVRGYRCIMGVWAQRSTQEFAPTQFFDCSEVGYSGFWFLQGEVDAELSTSGWSGILGQGHLANARGPGSRY